MSLFLVTFNPQTHSSGPPTRDLPVLTPTMPSLAQGETFLLGQIFVFGGFTLRANLLGHLEQIESYAPGRQVRFGSLNFTADVPGMTSREAGFGESACDSNKPHNLIKRDGAGERLE